MNDASAVALPRLPAAGSSFLDWRVLPRVIHSGWIRFSVRCGS